MKKKESEIKIDFNSDFKFTEFCTLIFNHIKHFLRIDDDAAFKIELSLREVINNAILHGNKMDYSRRVFVSFKWSTARICITVKDENPEKVDFSKIEQRLENHDLMATNGRGIMIMRNYMDKVEFTPSDEGTTIYLEKAI